MPEPIIKIRNLTVEYNTRSGPLKAVDDVNLDIYKGEILGLVGESGCGKSTLSFALLRMIEKPNKIASGSIEFTGLGDVVTMSKRKLDTYRWAEVSMIFQAAQNALNPLLRIVDQAKLVMDSHGRGSKDSVVRGRVTELLRMVNLDPKRVLDAYPHELSGGMKQRVGIVMALLLNPKVIILDEPTTALDVISQARILEILKDIHREFGTTMIFITHDMSVIAELATRMVVMYAGKIAETGMVDQVFYEPGHPYTQALMRAVPGLEGDPRGLAAIPGQPPDLRKLAGGCRFQPRCPIAKDVCTKQEPLLQSIAENHDAACLRLGHNDSSEEVAQ